MSFDPSRMEDFFRVFNSSVSEIRKFEGCIRVDIYRDAKCPNVLFTISNWDSEISLNKYRNSELFGATWAKTKQFFNAPPTAWSLIDAQ